MELGRYLAECRTGPTEAVADEARDECDDREEQDLKSDCAGEPSLVEPGDVGEIDHARERPHQHAAEEGEEERPLRDDQNVEWGERALLPARDVDRGRHEQHVQENLTVEEGLTGESLGDVDPPERPGGEGQGHREHHGRDEGLLGLGLSPLQKRTREDSRDQAEATEEDPAQQLVPPEAGQRVDRVELQGSSGRWKWAQDTGARSRTGLSHANEAISQDATAASRRLQSVTSRGLLAADGTHGVPRRGRGSDAAALRRPPAPA